jgi:hypothetical protein
MRIDQNPRADINVLEALGTAGLCFGAIGKGRPRTRNPSKETKF